MEGGAAAAVTACVSDASADGTRPRHRGRGRPELSRLRRGDAAALHQRGAVGRRTLMLLTALFLVVSVGAAGTQGPTDPRTQGPTDPTTRAEELRQEREKKASTLQPVKRNRVEAIL